MTTPTQLEEDDVKEIVQKLLDWAFIASQSNEISFKLNEKLDSEIPDTTIELAKALAFDSEAKKDGKIYIEPLSLEEKLINICVVVCELFGWNPEDIDNFERKIPEENLN